MKSLAEFAWKKKITLGYCFSQQAIIALLDEQAHTIIRLASKAYLGEKTLRSVT